ncbi:hypothetical protein [Neotamlana nanhaiensis]|uniref:hypothetical protein n=1 Tax=Neotamlana nanhaiensis TaxID=1382798 RepID=UPI00138DEC4A|nr:hypothetical protein [Tamlana nanhaiensis]
MVRTKNKGYAITPVENLNGDDEFITIKIAKKHPTLVLVLNWQIRPRERLQ